ncbi:hypothetical protein DRN74_00930 [Candidatus Micrarchaeota archaeon]|nr:MAG: hypothetical protein DRN74_00930 [Candidatus Micrarchaeota archaeon]
MERISTGITGLDEVLEGGFPHPSGIVITGPPGIGKTVFALQFLYEGARKGEAGFMMQIEGYATDVEWYAEKFSWDIQSLENEGKLLFSSFDPMEFTKFDLSTFHADVVLRLYKIIDSMKAKRIVVDSIAPIASSMQNEGQYRTLMYYLIKSLKGKNCTVLFVSEKESDKTNPEEYIADGVIELKYVESDGNINPTMFIKKMTATEIVNRQFSIQIDNFGFKIINPFGEGIF